MSELYGRLDSEHGWLYHAPQTRREQDEAIAAGDLWLWDGKPWIVTQHPAKRFEVLSEHPDAIRITGVVGA